MLIKRSEEIKKQNNIKNAGSFFGGPAFEIIVNAKKIFTFTINFKMNDLQSSAFNKQRQFEELLSFSRRLNSY